MVENELRLLSCAAHSTAHGVLSRLSPRRDFSNFAFHGEMKTAVKGVENGRKMGVRSMLRNVDFTNTGSVQFPRESITILGSWKYLISAAHL